MTAAMPQPDETTASPAPLTADTAAPKRTKPEVSPSPPTPRPVKRALAATAAKAVDPQVKAIRDSVRAQGAMNTAAQAKTPRRMTEQFRRREYDPAGRETAS